MKTKFYYWYNYLLSSLLWVLGFGMMGCTEQGDEYGPEPVMYGPAPSETVPDSLIYTNEIEGIDLSYHAPISELMGIWHGDYTGWDAKQKKTVSVRRELTLNPNGTYSNRIAGKMVDYGKNDYILFESEEGMYTYNVSSGIVTYTCHYDSLINFHDQSYTRYNKKHYYDREVLTYSETALFTTKKDGIRLWVTRDKNLLVYLNGEPVDAAFAMRKE